MAEAADHGHDPLGIRIVAAAHIHAEPDHGLGGAALEGLVGGGVLPLGGGAEGLALLALALVRALGPLAAVARGFAGLGSRLEDVFGGGQPAAIHAHQRARDILGGALGHEHLGELGVFLGVHLGEDRIILHALLVSAADFLRRGGTRPEHVDARLGDEPFGLAAAGIGRQQNADALAARAARAAAAMQQGVAVIGQFGVDDEFEARQIDAARRHVRRHADPRAAIAQGLQRMGALVLGEFARERHGGEAALHQARVQMAHGLAGLAEDQRARRLEIAQHIDDRMLDLVGSDQQGAIFDVPMGLALVHRVDAEGVALVAARQGRDVPGNGGGEEQGAALGGGGVEDELHVFAKAQIKHFVGFIEHHGAQGAHIETAALQMVAQAPGGAHHDMAAIFQRARLAAHIHAADAGGDAGARGAIEPDQLALHLHGEFAGGRHDQRHGGAGGADALFARKQGGGEGEAIGHGLARARLGGDEQIAFGGVRLQHGGLDGGGFGVTARFKSAFKAGIGRRKRHEARGLTVRRR